MVGAGVGIITSGAIDSMWENGVDNMGDAGDLIGDAAGAVGGGIKDAWNATL